jgi:hypothetical protein
MQRVANVLRRLGSAAQKRGTGVVRKADDRHAHYVMLWEIFMVGA